MAPLIDLPRAGADRWGHLVSLLVLPTLLLGQFFDLRRGVTGQGSVYSAHLVGFTVLALLCLPWLLRPSRTTRGGRLMLALFTALLGWALYSASTTPLPRLLRPSVLVGREYLVVPVLTAVVTMLAGWGLAAAAEPSRRADWLRHSSLLLVLTTFLAWARTATATGNLRLATGMGGAAVYHVVLLLCLGVLLGSAAEGRHRTTDALASAACVVGILLTGSRAGLLCLAGFAVLVGLRLAASGRGRQVAVWGLGAALAFVGFLLAFPPARRLLQVGDFARQVNIRTALRVFGESSQNTWFGVGSGRMWPWAAFETGLAPVPWRNIVVTNFGRVNTNPHSLVLGVLVELGLVGATLLLAFLAVLLVLAVRALRTRPMSTFPEPVEGTFPRPTTTFPEPVEGTFPRPTTTFPGPVEGSPTPRSTALARTLPVLALLCTLPAFVLDHYLLKNFGVSLWWWLVLAALLGTPVAHPAVRPTPESRAHHTAHSLAPRRNP